MQRFTIKTRSRMFCSMCLVASLSALTAQNAQASLIAADSFDYAPGQSLDGLNGGTGWDGGWDVPFGTADVIASTGTAPNLDPPDGLVTSGNEVKMTPNSSYARIQRDLGQSLNMNPVTQQTYFASVLIRRDDPDNATGGEVSYPILFRDSSGNNVVRFTYGSDEAIVVGNGSASQSSAAGAFPIGQTVLAVLKIVANPTGTDDVVSAVLLGSGDDLSAEPTSYDVSVSAPNDGSITTFLIHTSAGAGTHLVDEVRIGTTYADVVPVPEPSTLSIVGLIGLAFLASSGVMRRRWDRT